MNNLIDVSRRQIIDNYLQKMLGDNDINTAGKRINQSHEMKTEVVKKAINRRGFIFENMFDED
jgi:hypothetical protein